MGIPRRESNIGLSLSAGLLCEDIDFVIAG